MDFDFDRIIADLRRKREALAEVVESVTRTREERDALLRTVERLRQPVTFEPPTKPPEMPSE